MRSHALRGALSQLEAMEAQSEAHREVAGAHTMLAIRVCARPLPALLQREWPTLERWPHRAYHCFNWIAMDHCNCTTVDESAIASFA